MMQEKFTILDRSGKEIRRDTRGLEWAENVARYLDSRFVIPGTNIRFGLDPVLSLFPVIGDLFSYAVSGILIYTMYTRGASRKVAIKMILNVTLDAVIGAIPLAGTIFDVFYRANDRNVRLMKEHYLEGRHHGSGNGILIAIAVMAFLTVAAAFYGMWKLMQWLLAG